MKWYEFFLDGTFLALAGAAIAVIVAGIGSARAVGMVGEAAAGLISEEPERFGQTLLLQALPGTQGIYGLLTAFVILTKIGVVGGADVNVGTVQGLLLFGAAIPIAIVGYFSAIAQGRAAAAGINIVAKRPSELAKAITYAAMVETYAVLALLASILMVFGIQL
ncbi:MAG TPA: V-type ATP synthase subunit K [Clostridiaceae bacterium]|nr:V-type ATP synthase subunit K [Clostridiaceae bacterium]